MALIPTESNYEILTSEFKGKIDNREFLIYINGEKFIADKGYYSYFSNNFFLITNKIFF